MLININLFIFHLIISLTDKCIAAVENTVIDIFDSFGCPTFTYIYIFELLTVVEHKPHSCYLWGVKAAKVKLCESLAVFKHIFHSGNVACIPTWKVNTLKRVIGWHTAGRSHFKETLHTGNLTRIPAAEICPFKSIASVKHRFKRGYIWSIPWACINFSEHIAAVEHLLEGGCWCSIKLTQINIFKLKAVSEPI